MQHNYNTELNSLSNLLYKCGVASSWYDNIDEQLNIIKSNGFNKDVIKNDITNKYLVYFHIDPNNNTGVSIYITQLTDEIRHGSKYNKNLDNLEINNKTNVDNMFNYSSLEKKPPKWY